MTAIINFYAGPGTGKSTSASYLYYLAKSANVNAELVREYVKDWAWEKRNIGTYDQIYLLGKQVRRESMMYGKVDLIVTDAPIMLGSYYANHHAPEPIAKGIDVVIDGFYRQAADEGHKHFHVFLERTKKYNPAGRFQTEAQAREIDGDIKTMLLSRGIVTLECGTSERSLKDLYARISKKMRE